MMRSIYHVFQWLSKGKKKAKLYSNTSLAFPSSDVNGKSAEEDIFYLNVLNLSGVDSPLPSYLNVLAMKDENIAWRDFLNTINHYLYMLLYLAWKKFQPLLDIQSEQAQYLYYLQSLSGMVVDPKDRRLLRYVHCYVKASHQSRDLTKMVKDLLPYASVEVKEQIPRWESIQTDNEIRLSETAMLGDRVLMGGQEIAVTLTLIQQSFIALYYSSKLQQLKRLVDTFIPEGIAFKINAKVSVNQKEPLALGGDIVQLCHCHLIGKNKSVVKLVNL